MPASAPSLAVVIPTHNRRAILERTLDALEAQSQPDFRIVVVDDGSTDGTGDWLERRTAACTAIPRLAVIRETNRGQGQARNRALREVEEDLVLFLGDDIIPCPEFVAEHRAAHALHSTSGPIAIVGFTDWRRSEMRVTPALEMANVEGHQFGFAHMTAGREVPFTCFYTSNISLPRALLGEDPFAAEFAAYGWEDIELGYRLSLAGLRLVYHPAASAEHLHPMTLGDLFARQRLVGNGLRTLWKIHPELRESPLLSAAAPPRWFAAGRKLVPPLVPLLSSLDGAGVDLGKRILHRVLLCGYYLGQEAA